MIPCDSCQLEMIPGDGGLPEMIPCKCCQPQTITGEW